MFDVKVSHLHICIHN